MAQSTHKFKPGDRVRVVDDVGVRDHLQVGRTYTIKDCGWLTLDKTNLVYHLEEMPDNYANRVGFFERRFRLEEQTPFSKSLRTYLDAELG